jgi:hypothetical protein
MLRKSNLALASFAACALSLMSTTSWAAIVNVQIRPPVIHVPAPAFHVNAPVISVKPPVASVKQPVRPSIALGRGSQRLVNGGNTTGRNWPSKNSGGTRAASFSGVVVTQGSNGKTTQSPDVTVTQASKGQTASAGNAVYSATTTNNGQNGGGNRPIQIGVPNEWPTPIAGENVPPAKFWIDNPIATQFGSAQQLAQATANLQTTPTTTQPASAGEASALSPTGMQNALTAVSTDAAALQAEAQYVLGNINYELGLLSTQLTYDENELNTLLGEFNQAQECSAPSSGVQCPSLSVAQIEQEINILLYNIASITWAIDTINDFMVAAVLGTVNGSQGGYTQQTLTDLLTILNAAGMCVIDSEGGFACFQDVGAILQGPPSVFPSSWFPPDWDPGINIIQDMGFVPPCLPSGAIPPGFSECQ